jgi:RNA polymerase sigma-70 factor (ECF subfamily)
LALRVDDVDLVRDRALVERFQEGDPAAFDTLYTRYFGRLVRFCQKRVGDPHEAEEIAQEAFTKALRALPAFEGERRFYPWMTVIAGRLCVDAHRRRGRTEPSSSVDLGVIEGGQEKIVDLVDIEILRTAMAELAPRHREVLDLRELQGWSYQQIADHYDVTLGTVEALLFRARKALKREFMAVVGGDRNWAALPVLGGVFARGAAFKAKVQAWASTALPSVSGPAVAAALAVTAVTGAVGAGVLHDDGVFGDRAQPPTVVRIHNAAVTTSLPELLTDPAPVVTAAEPSGRAPAAAPKGGDVRGPLAEALSPRAETPVADVVGSDAAGEKSKEQPINEDVADVFFGVDPVTAAVEVGQRVDNYTHNITDLGDPK